MSRPCASCRPLQFAARLRLGLIERPQRIGKTVMPTVVLVPAQLPPDGIETAHPRQNRDQAGSPALVPLQANAFHLGVVSLFQGPPFAALTQGKIVALA